MAWLVGMCDKTTDCEELTAILRQSKYFQKIPVFVKVQPLKLRKNDPDTQWGSSEYTRVVTIQGVKRLHKVTLVALKKIFNCDKPKHVQNRPNSTTAKMVPWYRDARSPTTALCHSGYAEEVNEIMMNLVTLCKERFWQKYEIMVYPGGRRRSRGSGL